MLPFSTESPTPTPAPSPESTPLDAGEAVSHTWDWLTGPGLRIAIIVVIGMVVLLVVQRMIRSTTEHIADGSSFLQRGIVRGAEMGGALRKVSPVATARRTQRARTIGSVLRSTAAIVIGTITVFLVLDQVGVNLAPFIASAGVVGVALGFGAQSLVKDFLTGLFMLLEDQYGVGDVVDVGPAIGTVESVGLRVTKIRDSDGVLWYVPNGSVLRVGNKTQGWSNAVVEVKVDYFVDLDQVQTLLEKAAADVAKDEELRTVMEGNATVTSAEDLAFDAVTMRLVQRTVPAKQWKVSRALREAVRRELTGAGIPLAGQREALTAYQEERQTQEGPRTQDSPGDHEDPGAGRS
jgi:moderate conductance mechanosensitive channel